MTEDAIGELQVISSNLEELDLKLGFTHSEIIETHTLLRGIDVGLKAAVGLLQDLLVELRKKT